jgi:hypothetical protein
VRDLENDMKLRMLDQREPKAQMEDCRKWEKVCKPLVRNECRLTGRLQYWGVSLHVL